MVCSVSSLHVNIWRERLQRIAYIMCKTGSTWYVAKDMQHVVVQDVVCVTRLKVYNTYQYQLILLHDIVRSTLYI